MASIAASIRRLAAVTARQSSPTLYRPPTLYRSAIRIPATPRSFSSFQPLRDEFNTEGQVGMRGKASEPIVPIRQMAQPEPPEGDPNILIEKDWKYDDFSSIAHAELERHREARQYARIIAYEMPQLSALVRPFVPPNDKEILRFRYTTYMGEKHPAQSKVVCEFATSDLPLTDVQRRKLIKLVGVRYNPDTDLVRMSSEMFERQSQNKRYLSDLVDTLIAEAEDPTDTFEDIPFDFRHHEARKAPPKPKFPAEWRLSPKRRAQLEKERASLKKMFEKDF